MHGVEKIKVFMNRLVHAVKNDFVIRKKILKKPFPGRKKYGMIIS